MYEPIRQVVLLRIDDDRSVGWLLMMMMVMRMKIVMVMMFVIR